jgi:hypothetical protein
MEMTGIEMAGCRLGGVPAASAETEGGGALIRRPAKKPGIHEDGDYPLHADPGNSLDNCVRHTGSISGLCCCRTGKAHRQAVSNPSEIPDKTNAVCADNQKDPSVSNETRIESYLGVKQLAIA